ncbi:MAG TPA: hypothetical protein VEG44_02600 [Candidatus Acidoferrales bacterium]|nr:hypothetical protein [Candidatus Acidoferrales bacterium]
MKPHWLLCIIAISIMIISGTGCAAQIQNASSATQTIGGITIPTTTGPPTPAEA